MKTNLKTIATFLSLCMLVFSAHAIVVFQDGFNYPGGGLVTVSSGTWVLGYGNANSSQIIAQNNSQLVIPGTSTSDQPRAFFTNGPSFLNLANYTNAGVVYISNAVAAYFPSNDPAAALYASFSLTIPNSTGLGNTYFAVFADTNFDYRCRISIATNGAAAGNYRIGIGNSALGTNFVQSDMAPGNAYTVVMRYVLNSGISTAWVNPSTESTSDPTVSATGGGAVNIGGVSANVNSSTCSFVLRNATGFLNLTMANLIIGTTFADVVPSSVGLNPPFVVQQPLDDISGITNDTVTFSTLAAGDLPLGYQWYFLTNGVTNVIVGATGSNLVLNDVVTNQAGSYFAAITNDAGTNFTRLAKLIVYPAPVAVVVSNQPQSLVVNVGDTATFSVLASGVPPPTYQWYYITNLTTTFKTNAIAGATFPTLTITNLNTNSFTTNLFVTVVNRVNSTNTIPASLIVRPVQTLTIAQLRSMVDSGYNPTNTTSIFTIQGIVTTWNNLTTSGNSEFYVQDATAGIAVFWSGAPASTNLPPGGALVKVTAPLAAFSGLLESEPVFSNPFHKVTIISTNNPLPTPQPLPFDPSLSTAQLEALQGSYFVASNVTLAAASTFVSGANVPMTANASNTLTAPMFNLTFTNLQGEQFIMFINSGSGLPGKAQPTGPLTIYGVLGYFNGVGAEFTPSRLADVISYIHFTNILSHLTRPGDAPTNNYAENFLLPGGTLTSLVSISDPAGGSVTLSPMGSLPASASWSNITNGNIGTAVFHFKPVAADSGSNYTVNLGVTSTAGTVYTNSITVYVPATNEQLMAITEILPNPTINTNAPNFNPLLRTGGDSVGAATNDEYVEIANVSGGDLIPGWTLDNGNTLIYLFDSRAGLYGTTIQSSNSMVLFGGNTGVAQPGILPSSTVTPSGLQLSTNTSGLLVLRNINGNIIDRVVYAPTDLNTNGALTRFPTLNGPFVPQPYVSTNLDTPGNQYDGAPWSQASQIPVAVTNLLTTLKGTNFVVKFSAATGQASTLWNASGVTGPYKVIYGYDFLSAAGAFSNVISSPQQFYFITTQTNH